jgi:hypothetical protein
LDFTLGSRRRGCADKSGVMVC